MRPLTDREFNLLYDDMFARADKLGRTSVKVTPPDRPARKVEMTVTVPGQEGDPRLPDEVLFKYEEWFRRTALGWVRVRYNYNYFDIRRGGRWGLHLHPLPGHGRTSGPHMVCVWPDGRGNGKHYGAHEVELRAAHETFVTHYAEDRPVTCVNLVPLD